VILFTEKTSIPPLFRALSMEYKDQIRFGIINKDQAALANQLGAKRYPSILIITEKGQNYWYTDKMKFRELTEYLSSYTKDLRVTQNQRQGHEAEPMEVTPKNVGTVCKHLCVVLPTSSSSTEIKRAVKESKYYDKVTLCYADPDRWKDEPIGGKLSEGNVLFIKTPQGKLRWKAVHGNCKLVRETITDAILGDIVWNG